METNTLILLMSNGTTQGQSKPTAIIKLSATVSGASQENQPQNMQQNVPSISTYSTFNTGTTEYGESTTPASAPNINNDPRSVPSMSTDTSIPAIPDQVAATALEYTNIVTPTVHVPGH